MRKQAKKLTKDKWYADSLDDYAVFLKFSHKDEQGFVFSKQTQPVYIVNTSDNPGKICFGGVSIFYHLNKQDRETIARG